MKKFKVEQRIGFGWDDAEWTVDGQPMRFDSIEEAQAEIDEFINDCLDEGMIYHREDYQVVEVHE